jgi:hypothetical protein
MRLPDLSLHNLQTRLLAAFVLLMIAVGSTSLIVVHVNTTTAVRKTVGAEVVAGARAFERLLELDSQRLVEGARLLTGDPAFRETATTGDRDSLGPALAKHGKRIGSAVMLFVDADRKIVAGTLAGEIGKRFSQSKLLDRASAAQQATALVPSAGSSTSWSSCRCSHPSRSPGSPPGSDRRCDGAGNAHLTGLDVTSSVARRRANGRPRQHAAGGSNGAGARLAPTVRDRSDGNAEFGDEMITRGDQPRRGPMTARSRYSRHRYPRRWNRYATWSSGRRSSC